MIETIPNHLNNKNVQKEINDRVSIFMCMRANMSFCEIDKYIQSAINDVARWGVALGFNMGWHARDLQENYNKHDGTQPSR